MADVKDAFWLIPLAWEERRHFVAKFRGRYLVFLRTAQGSRGAPLTWAAVASLAARCVQSVFITPHGQEARLQMYVDDPLLALKGSESHRARLVARFLCVWLLLGFDIAYAKAHYGQSLTWIGVRFQIREVDIVASIPPEKVADLLQLIASFLKRNVIPVKEVRSVAGKCMNIASLIFFWRPFLTSFWAALASEETFAPESCIWTRQISTTLHWLQAFLQRECGHMERIFSIDAFFNRHIALEVTTDASPWGIGGWVSLSGKPLSWFAAEVSQLDALHLQREWGTHLAQQAFEALAILVAVRQWKRLWQQRRVSLRIRSDNVGALTVASALKGRGSALTLVARELAFEVGTCECAPDVIEHLPGVANTTADVLSRRLDPGHSATWQVPLTLAGVPECRLEPRLRAWWRTLGPPSSERTG